MSIVDRSNLESAIMFSLLSHKKVGKEGGYWVDAIDGISFGSLFWKLQSEPLTSENIEKIRLEALSTLSWITDRGILQGIKVFVRKHADTIAIKITDENEIEVFFHEL